MYVKRPLDFSSLPVAAAGRHAASGWPSTSPRPGSSCADGYAGKVIDAFGHFVIGGSLVVGLVIFAILLVIQFVVITNGAGRVAEVGARFTLDAMPGKQMAIDADLNAGLIDDTQARRRRAEIAAEADFYGAMDGATQVRQGRRDRRDHHHVDQPDRRLRHRHVAAPHDVRSEALHTYSLLSDRRRSGLPDPGAAALGRDRPHRHPGQRPRTTWARDVAEPARRQPRARCRSPAAPRSPLCLVPGLPKLPFLLVGGGAAASSRSALTANAKAEAAAPRPTARRAAGDRTPPEAMLLADLRVDPLETRPRRRPGRPGRRARRGDLLDRVRGAAPQARRRTRRGHAAGAHPRQPRPAAVDVRDQHQRRRGRAGARRRPACVLAIGDGLDGAARAATRREPVFGLAGKWIAGRAARRRPSCSARPSSTARR